MVDVTILGMLPKQCLLNGMGVDNFLSARTTTF